MYFRSMAVIEFHPLFFIKIYEIFLRTCLRRESFFCGILFLWIEENRKILGKGNENSHVIHCNLNRQKNSAEFYNMGLVRG